MEISHEGERHAPWIQILSSLVLTAVLAAPIAMVAAVRPQDSHNQENRQDNHSRRYYDRGHKDYHTWDSNEDRAYRRYQTEYHQTRAFIKLSSRQQTIYWTWRHNNPD